MARSLTKQISILPSLAAIGAVVMILICHVIVQEHVIKGSSNFTW